jgi:hypothetical protein
LARVSVVSAFDDEEGRMEFIYGMEWNGMELNMK